MACTTALEISSPVMVDAQIKRWTLTNDDIYLLKFNEEPPQWLEDIINGVVFDMNLVGDISDLEDRFSNFEKGYTSFYYEWVDGNDEFQTKIDTLWNSNSVMNAGIQEIRTTYISRDESRAVFDTLVAAWQTGAGGAWFNERVSTIANVAYSSAKSASTLTATLGSQQNQLSIIAGDIKVLEKQIDGKVETWKGFDPVVNPNGTLIETSKPYYCWAPGIICSEPEFNDSTAVDTRAEHTGDTYLHVELDANNKERLLGVYRFGKDTNTDTYNWFILTDDLAAVAYQQALDAGVLADGKINSYYQTTPPTNIEDPTLGAGDIWIDSDDHNKMYRYNGTSWKQVRDTDITASVDRLDEATVDIGGHARAKSSLSVNADGVVAGFVLEADNATSSSFKIFADKFIVTATNGAPAITAPFRVDATTREIFFNGIVKFSNIRTDSGGDPDWLFSGQAAKDINQHTTTINGGKITAYSLNANRIATDTLWSRGAIMSADYNGYSSGYIGNGNPNGFYLNAKAGAGNYNYPNLYGSYIRGGIIYGTTITGATINAGQLNLGNLTWLTEDGKPTRLMYQRAISANGYLGYYPNTAFSCNFKFGIYGTQSSGDKTQFKVAKRNGAKIQLGANQTFSLIDVISVLKWTNVTISVYLGTRRAIHTAHVGTNGTDTFDTGLGFNLTWRYSMTNPSHSAGSFSMYISGPPSYIYGYYGASLAKEINLANAYGNGELIIYVSGYATSYGQSSTMDLNNPYIYLDNSY